MKTFAFLYNLTLFTPHFHCSPGSGPDTFRYIAACMQGLSKTVLLKFHCVLLFHSLAGVAQWVARLYRNWSVLSLKPFKGSHCFFEQETLHLLLNTGWLQDGNSTVSPRSKFPGQSQYNKV